MSQELSIEEKARELGWAPKESFRGDKEKWIDAEAYVKRGEELMPILRANNAKLLGEVSTLRGELSSTRDMLKAAAESIEALKEYNTEATLRTAKIESANLTEALKAARAEGDVEKEHEIAEQLEEHRQAIKEAGKPVVKKDEPVPTIKEDPAFVTWREENPWFGQGPSHDKRRSSVMLAIATELRNDPANTGLKGREFLDKVVDELEKTFPSQEPRRSGNGKVEGGGRGSGGSGGGGDVGKTYSDLPADVKVVCDRQAGRLVGPNRAYKTLNDWRAKYAEDYFNS